MQDPEVRRTRTAILERHARAIDAVAKAGGRLTVGTDAPIVPYGVSLSVELEIFVKAGMTPFQALQAVTVTNAELLGAETDLGTIEPGKLADLVVIEGNPLANIRAVRNVHAVIKNGEVFPINHLVGSPVSDSVTFRSQLIH
jgi:imidazolonepropionase-like amidohydrolase